MADVFGFHPIDENLADWNESDDFSGLAEGYYDAQNLLNVLGWIPLCGTVVGVIRICGGVLIWTEDTKSHRHRKFYFWNTVRGIVETLSVGFVFILPDLLKTWARGIKRKNIRFHRKKK